MDISEQVLQAFRQGNIEPFYRELFPSLLRYAERVLGEGHAHETEDCIQEAIYKVYCHRKQFDSPAHMRTFLYTCVHNEIISLHRKRQTLNRFLKLHRQEEFEESLFEQLVVQETLDRLNCAIDTLPPHLRQILDMSFGQGLRNVEIARLLSLSAEAVKKRKAKMISLLRTRMKGDGEVRSR